MFDTALDCGIIAIGADFTWSVGTSTSTKWAISAIKKVFRSVASRFLGPVGVGIALATFTGCMFLERSRYTCVYRVRIPTSKYDELYSKATLMSEGTLAKHP